ncbi:hypothetical protein VTL71DRAFT_6743 [Oculimacula yallundae]|uniref:Uncharacterized protein n=1 Tax=Oculimacula yallundae TaxID=86028 RepID=A0ABR4BYS5_9HELO
MSNDRFDVAVVGLGVLGSAAAYHAAIKGARVIGFEQFEFGHVRGASHDTSRIVRTSYGSPEYVALARAAYKDWADLERRSGIQMLTITGGVVFFPKLAPSTATGKKTDISEFEKTMSAVEFARSLDANGIPYELLENHEVKKRWPEFDLPDGVQTIYTADSGVVHASRSVAAMQNLARTHGAILKEHTCVEKVIPVDDGVIIESSKGRFHAKKVILTADAWANKLLAPLGAEIPLNVMQEQVTYFKPADIMPFAETKFPVWIWAGKEYFYGFPSYGEPTIKAARDMSDNLMAPEQRTFVPSDALLNQLSSFVDGLIPNKGQILRTVTCQYAVTPDRQFVVSPLKKHKNILVGLGAGHAFKFAPAIGRVLAELAIDGKTSEDVSLFGIPKTRIIVVGAGPSGLVLSLLLAKVPGITVILLDSASKVDDRPRAAHYAPSAIRVLAAAGVLPDIRARGLIPDNMTWRNIRGEVITSIKNVSQHPYNPEALTVLPLNMLGELLLEHVARHNNIEVRWNANVVDVVNGEEKVWAVVRRTTEAGDDKKVEGDYLVGCDGANSSVRGKLFGTSFPGKTWDAQIVATNVYYPLEKFGYDDINFVIDPVDYYMAAKITKDGMWRVSYGEDTALTLEQVIAHQPAKYERMLPGNPKPGSYKLLNVGPYRIHQRCAPSFRVGRVLLAADAAHLCNPFGGLGLTGGLVDVSGLAQCFEGIARGVAGDEILNLYDSVRRGLWETVINPISSENFLRVSATDPEKALTDDPFLMIVNEAEEDEVKRRILDERAYAICHDFRQYWKGRDLVIGQKEAKL